MIAGSSLTTLKVKGSENHVPIPNMDSGPSGRKVGWGGEGRQGCELPSTEHAEDSIEEAAPREEYRGGLNIAVLGARGQGCLYTAQSQKLGG